MLSFAPTSCIQNRPPSTQLKRDSTRTCILSRSNPSCLPQSPETAGLHLKGALHACPLQKVSMSIHSAKDQGGKMRRGFRASPKEKDQRLWLVDWWGDAGAQGPVLATPHFFSCFHIGIKGKDGTYPQARKVKRKALSSTSLRAVLPHSAKRKLK